MGKTKVGLYLGVNSLGGVIVDKKKIVSLARFDLSAIDEDAKAENLNDEVKWEALINKTMREIGAETKEVYVTFTDRDFIFRAFDMPMMKKKEIETSLSYEIEKYIPFKLEQLRWDYSYVAMAKEKKLNISFVGIRENNFQRVWEILTRLGLTPVVIEPASLSLVRVIKSFKNLSRLTNYAMLDFTESEGYLTFFCSDLPVFSRYLTVPLKDGSIDREKFIEPIHLSFQYFKREYKFYDLDRFIILSNSRDEALANSLKDELQIPVDVFSPYDFTGNANSSMETLKALGVAGIDQYPYKFKPVFTQKTKEQIQKGAAVKEVPLNVGGLGFLLGLGLMATFLMGMFMSNSAAQKKSAMQAIDSEMIRPRIFQDKSWDQIGSAIKEKEQATAAVEQLKASTPHVVPLLDAVYGLRPKGLWLDSLEFTSMGDKTAGLIKGYVFLGDSYQERRGVDGFVEGLKKDDGVKDVFKSVNMVSTRKETKQNYELTAFTIKLE